MSDDDLIRRADIDRVHTCCSGECIGHCREVLMALPADPYAAAAIRLAEASLAYMKSTRECEIEDIRTCDCEECVMIRTMREFDAAREARK